MTASAYQLFVFSVLAAPLIDDLGLSRAQLGLLGSVNTLVGATTAPLTGRLTDRIGARRSVVAVLVISATGMAALALAPTTPWLVAAAVVGGVPQGWGNPATNSLIAGRVPAGRRGSVTGVKQSGVTLGVFLSGASLPALEAAWGWRGAAWTFAAAFTMLALVVQLTLGADPVPAESARVLDAPEATRRPLDPLIVRLAVYALLMGSAGGAVGRFFALFAEESVGYSTAAAGLMVAIGGLLGMAARVVVGRLAEHRIAATRLLGLLATVGVGYCLLLAAATPGTRWLLPVSPPVNAIGIAAWNAVAMLAIITSVSTADSGRASGLVMVGFLGGLTLSGPLAGMAVDRWGVYWPVWLIAAGLALAAAGTMFLDPVVRRTEQQRTEQQRAGQQRAGQQRAEQRRAEI